MAISTPFNAALAAYGNVQGITGGSALGRAAPSGPDFAQMLGEAVQGVIDSGNASDAKAMQLVNGQGNVVDVVTAISETELAIESMVTVRDRVISAYEEIMRMPI